MAKKTVKNRPVGTPPPVEAEGEAGGSTPLGIVIPRIDLGQMEITLVGDSELIMNQWSQKAIDMMLLKQTKGAKTAKEAKDPEKDFQSSMYRLPDGRYAFPSIAFKSAAVGACRFSDGVKMTEARGAFHVLGELIPIEGEPRRRQDMVRVGMGTADIRFRGGFPEWRATIVITYNRAALSVEQITNLFNLAGFGVGIGEWRPEKNGPFGRFHVASEGE